MSWIINPTSGGLRQTWKSCMKLFFLGFFMMIFSIVLIPLAFADASKYTTVDVDGFGNVVAKLKYDPNQVSMGHFCTPE